MLINCSELNGKHKNDILGEVETSLYDLIPESITNEI